MERNERDLPLWPFHAAYYLFIPLVFAAFFAGASWLLGMVNNSNDLGTAIAATLFLLYAATPILMAVLMRFSLLRWYVDPFAAAEIPLFLYVSMLLNQAKRAGSLRSAFLLVNGDLADDSGAGWIFLLALFLFGLLLSFSVARKKGRNLPYRWIGALQKNRKKRRTHDEMSVLPK